SGDDSIDARAVRERHATAPPDGPIVSDPPDGFLPRCEREPTQPSKRSVLSLASCPSVRLTWKFAALIPRKCRTQKSPVSPTSRVNVKAICCASICWPSGSDGVPIVNRAEFHCRWSISFPKVEEAVTVSAIL